MSNSGDNKKLYSKVSSLFSVTVTLQGIAVILDLAFLSILARFLLPEDYGVVAIAVIVLTFFNIFQDVGVANSITQLPNLTKHEERAGFSIAILIGLTVFGLTQLLAEPFAAFMRNEDVEMPLRLLAFITIVQSLSTVSQGLLLRQLKAQILMVIEIGAKFTGFATVGLYMAVNGYGYWSLVGAMMLQEALRALGLVLIARPSFRPTLNLESFRRLFSVGLGFITSRIINFVALKAGDVIVGRYLDAASLGLYSRAVRIMSLPNDLYTKVANRVVFPAMSKVQGDQVRLKRSYLISLELTALVGIPLTMVLFLLAPEIIAVLLGKNWLDVVPIYTILVAGSYFRLSARVSGSLLRSIAAIRLMILAQVIYAVSMVGALLYAVQFGLLSVASAAVVIVFVYYVVITSMACSRTRVGLSEFFASQKSGFLLGIVLSVPLVPFTYATRANGVPSLLLLVGFSLVLGAALLVILRLGPRFVLGDQGMRFIEELHRGFGRLAERVKAR